MESRALEGCEAGLDIRSDRPAFDGVSKTKCGLSVGEQDVGASTGFYLDSRTSYVELSSVSTVHDSVGSCTCKSHGRNYTCATIAMTILRKLGNISGLLDLIIIIQFNVLPGSQVGL